jgi:hypothetical protein
MTARLCAGVASGNAPRTMKNRMAGTLAPRWRRADASLHRTGIRGSRKLVLAAFFARPIHFLPPHYRAIPGPGGIAVHPFRQQPARTLVLRQPDGGGANATHDADLFQVGAAALQYAPDACETFLRYEGHAVQQTLRSGRPACREAGSECLSIQMRSIDSPSSRRGLINSGCGIGPDFAIWLSRLGPLRLGRSEFPGRVFPDAGKFLEQQLPAATRTSRSGQA